MDETWRRGLKPSFLVKDLGGMFLYYPGQALVNRVPGPALDAFSGAGGRLVRLLGDTDMREELQAIYAARSMPRPEAEILADAYRLTLYNELEVLKYPHLNPATIADTCVVEGREHLDAALARGKGAIVLIGHFGANQMIMPALGHVGYRMAQLSAPPPVWAEILRDSRTTPLWSKVLERRWQLEKRLPVEHVNVFRFLRPAFEMLQQNGVLGLAFDGGGGKKWVKVDFLGRKANLSLQPAQIWKKSGAAMLPTYVIRAPGERRHRVVITPELAWQGTPEASYQAFVHRFEAWVYQWPEQYLHFLSMRRRVRGTDVQPFFDDYPPAAMQLDPAEAEERLRRAGEWREG
ncbi:MAG: lysophospholipid acyltransferase family protein [Deltaproteobacteria bacterium]|nr:lysophospholipid acyltransferase family protein [Deltaproteobacteria bacterium]